MPETRRALSALQTLYADNTSGDISAQDFRDGVQSMHGEKLVQTAAFASEPASDPLAGDLFLPNNGFYLERHSGSAWVPWGPLFPFTKPVSGDFAWINQGSASVVTTNGGIYLSGPSNSASYNWRIRKKAAPAAPYTITAAFLLNTEFLTSVSQGLGAILWRQSSDSKLVTISLSTSPSTGAATSPLIELAKWNNENSFSAYYDSAAVGFNPCPLLFVRIADDNTNRKVSISVDGQNFIQIHSVGRTDFLTADEVGFAISPYAQESGMTLLHWKEA